jgi:hypothetical protein
MVSPINVSIQEIIIHPSLKGVVMDKYTQFLHEMMGERSGWYPVFYHPVCNDMAYMKDGELYQLPCQQPTQTKAIDGKNGEPGKDGKVTVQVMENGVVNITDQDGHILIQVNGGVINILPPQ